MKFFIITLLSTFTLALNAQYTFTHTQELECTPVKSQARTGTCWSFATSSFIESELIRKGHADLNLSEMFVVRNIYKDKARNYVLRQGKANFSQGSLSHDLMRMMKKGGVIPEDVYSGLLEGEKKHDHSEMEAGLKGFLDGVLKQKRLSKKWPFAFEGILDAYMGSVPDKFMYNGKEHTPQSLASELGLDAGEYVSLTSFTHHPYHETFILEIPDNYSNGSFYNVPLEEMMAIIDDAVNKGYSIAWDGDVSEKGFDARKGIAVLPTDSSREDLFDTPGEEIEVTAQNRQDNFESYATTDDHLMHIVGKAKDQNGTEYYIIKNSWGEISPYKGYLYMSKAYVAMKTVAIMINKEVLSKKIQDNISE
ncbi:MAG: aminopeptidase [Saprospiraceae bacterium]|nr:C1 family peptidase [Bacteroidia bacterium]NNE16593.1 aminopeptidase [Saprospiraceae bacterium]NNL91513.1 aminopeptidase [Saprospiraceae bacterium]